MISGLSSLELGRLRMSVGYGANKKGRLLSPIEVASLLHNARHEGASLSDCATAIHLNETGASRFLRILNLPQDIQHLIDWGTPQNGIGFSTAVELARLQDVDDQRAVADSILSIGLTSKEVRQVAQLRIRSGRSIGACVKEVLGMRPTIERRYVFIGSVLEQGIADALTELTQAERDSILESGIERLHLQGASGRLGKRLFTLVGDESFNESMKTVGKENIEEQLCNHIAEAVGNAFSHR